MKRLSRVVAALVAGLLSASGAHADPPATQPIRVFAAASLSESFTALAVAFRTTHPGSAIEQNSAGSPALVAQIESGAPADLIATADMASMARLESAGLLSDAPKTFARNRLEIVVEPGNPKAVRGLADLARNDLVVVLAAETVPAGRYAHEVFERAGLRVSPRSLEENVKAVLNRVALGEADAGIVYATDVQAAGARVTGVAIAESQNAVATYPIALVKRSDPNPEAAAFRAFVLSEAGQAILARFGFLAP